MEHLVLGLPTPRQFRSSLYLKSLQRLKRSDPTAQVVDLESKNKPGSSALIVELKQSK
jgi:hypothetical protein